jgi:hypothetical protein
MGLTNENVGPKILAKIKIYVLTRAELLFKVCYEIPCIRLVHMPHPDACDWLEAFQGKELKKYCYIIFANEIFL